jgi:hypothetical protein
MVKPCSSISRDGRSRPVEFGRAVARLPEQDQSGVGEPVEQSAERGIVDVRQRLGRPGDQGRDAGVRRCSIRFQGGFW